jgi:hypothetical protein
MSRETLALLALIAALCLAAAGCGPLKRHVLPACYPTEIHRDTFGGHWVEPGRCP